VVHEVEVRTISLSRPDREQTEKTKKVDDGFTVIFLIFGIGNKRDLDVYVSAVDFANR